MLKFHFSGCLLVVTAVLLSGMVPGIALAQDRGQGRSMVISQSGIVATESPLASKAGAAILERGGNAVDAAIAAHAVMTVVAPMWNGIGGDLFAIVYDAKSGKYYGLNASGWAPAATIDRAPASKGTARNAGARHRSRHRSGRRRWLAEASRPIRKKENQRSSGSGNSNRR